MNYVPVIEYKLLLSSAVENDLKEKVIRNATGYLLPRLDKLAERCSSEFGYVPASGNFDVYQNIGEGRDILSRTVIWQFKSEENSTKFKAIMSDLDNLT